MRRHPGLNRKVLVALFSGTAVSGVLTKTAGHFLIVAGATVFEDTANPMQADGEIVIDRINVDYVQIVDGP